MFNNDMILKEVARVAKEAMGDRLALDL